MEAVGEGWKAWLFSALALWSCSCVLLFILGQAMQHNVSRRNEIKLRMSCDSIETSVIFNLGTDFHSIAIPVTWAIPLK